MQQGEEPEEGLVRVRRGSVVQRRNSARCWSMARVRPTKSPVPLGRQAAGRVDEHHVAIAGEAEELAATQSDVELGCSAAQRGTPRCRHVHQCPVLLAALGIEEAGQVAHGRQR